MIVYKMYFYWASEWEFFNIQWFTLHISEFGVWNLMESFNHLDDIIIYCQERMRCLHWVCSTFCWCLQITLAPTSTLVSTPIISLLWCSSSPALEVTLFKWIYNFLLAEPSFIFFAQPINGADTLRVGVNPLLYTRVKRDCMNCKWQSNSHIYHFLSYLWQ